MHYATPHQNTHHLPTRRSSELGGGTTSWRPLPWIQATADIGMDLTDRRDYILQRLGEGPTTATSRQGSAIDSRTDRKSTRLNSLRHLVCRLLLEKKKGICTK